MTSRLAIIVLLLAGTAAIPRARAQGPGADTPLAALDLLHVYSADGSVPADPPAAALAPVLAPEPTPAPPSMVPLLVTALNMLRQLLQGFLPPFLTRPDVIPITQLPGQRRAAAHGRPRTARRTPGRPGSSRTRAIALAARSLLGRPFRYARATRNGVRGCAQVVSTILRKAGVLPAVRLGVRDVVRDLRARSWRDIRPPPYRDGDVITWKTYDRDRDGRKDPDTHIGVIVMEGNTPYVVQNSSRKRRVTRMPLAAVRYPVTRVMREGGSRAS